MVRIIELVQIVALTVHRQCILRQVIGTNREEIDFLCQTVAHHNRRWGLNHDAKLYIIRHCNAFCRKFLTHILTNALDFLYLPNRSNHGEHNGNLAISRCTVQGTQLNLKDFRTGQTDTNGTQTHCRIFLMVQTKIVCLLVCTDIQSTDNDALAAHTLCNRLVSAELLFLSWVIIALQVQELRTEQTNPAAIVCEHRINIARVADIAVNHDIALELVEKLLERTFLGLLVREAFTSGIIGIYNDLTGLTVHENLLACKFRLELIAHADDCRNPHGTC